MDGSKDEKYKVDASNIILAILICDNLTDLQTVANNFWLG